MVKINQNGTNNPRWYHLNPDHCSKQSGWDARIDWEEVEDFANEVRKWKSSIPVAVSGDLEPLKMLLVIQSLFQEYILSLTSDVKQEPMELETEDEEELPVKELVERDRKISVLQAELKKLKSLYQHALEVSNTESILDVLDLRSVRSQPEAILAPKSNKRANNRPVAAVQLWSDWHIGKLIRSNHVNGLNEYNFEVAKQRVANLIRNSKSLLTTAHSDTPGLNTLVLWMGGDLIENYLRPENRTTNTLTPQEELLEGFRILKKALLEMASLEFIDTIKVICSPGNHGRMPETRKVPVSTRTEESLEMVLYGLLAEHFESDRRFEFTLNSAYTTYLKVYDLNFCFHHGDAIRYKDGVYGLVVPAQKWINKSNQSIRADVHAFGHWHNHMSSNGILVNGCLCGYDETYPQFGYSSMKPTQMIQLVDSHYGLTTNYKVFTD